MTDRIDVHFMGGQTLHKKEGSQLWYQEKGVVAAGSYTIDRLIHNLRAIGLQESAIWNLTSFVPLRVLNQLPQYGSGNEISYSFVSETKSRYAFQASVPEALKELELVNV